MATINGTSAVDYFVGSDDADSLSGLGGNDSLLGGAGADTLNGGTGDDYLDGGTGVDFADYGLAGGAVSVNLATGYASGADGNDTLAGIEGVLGSKYADLLVGHTDESLLGQKGFDNSLYGQKGDDTLLGGVGADTLIGGAGDDYLDGGLDLDLADYSSAGAAVMVNLATGRASGAEGNDTLLGIEKVSGSGYADALSGDAISNSLYGNSGNDTLSGAGGSDDLDGGSGNDSLLGGDGEDWFIGGGGDDYLEGGGGRDTANYGLAGAAVLVNLATGRASGAEGNDTLSGIEEVIGGAYADTLIGDVMNNRLSGSGGNDSLLGGDGTDTLYGGSGDDYLEGGTGVDFADYGSASASGAVSVNLATGRASGADGNDTLTGIEGVYGGKYADLLTGDAFDNTLYGQKGNDTLLGGAGADWLRGGAGDDYLDGGADADYADYQSASAAVVADLATGRASGAEGNDTLTGIENVIGGAYADTLTGDAADNMFYGLAGNDTLSGGGGFDIAAYSGHSTDYEIISSGNSVSVRDLNAGDGDDGLDTLVDIEQLQFADTTISFGNASPKISSSSAFSVDEDRAILSQKLIARDADNDLLSWRLLQNVSHGTLDFKKETASWSYVPDANFQGTDSFQVEVDDGKEGRSNQTITITVNPINDPPFLNTLKPFPDQIATEGIPWSVIIPLDTFGDPDPGDQLLWSINRSSTSGPVLDFDPVSRRVSLTPENGVSGQYNYQIRVTDGTGATASDSFVLTIDNVNDAPVVRQPLQDKTSQVRNEFVYILPKSTFSDPDDTELNISATLADGSALPSWLNFNEETLTLSGTPDIGQIGSQQQIRVTATDAGGLSAMSGFVLTLLTDSELKKGNGGSDTLDGGSGSDTLYGFGGDDFLDGGSGDDLLDGGTGDDHYMVDSDKDLVVELPGGGTDDVVANVSYILPTEVENLTLVGLAKAATGNVLPNRLYGNGQDNILDGDQGGDTMEGRGGDDVYIVDSDSDVVIEFTGQGKDTVFSSVDFQLRSNAKSNVDIERLVLTGPLNLKATGNEINNLIEGNSGNNSLVGGEGEDTLYGYEGDDTLDGGLGADRMLGGKGNDTYFVDNPGDLTIELVGEGGRDQVFANITHALQGNLEILTLVGNAAIDGSGNDLNNELYGNDANNLLEGLAGNDKLEAGSGNDTMLGGEGDDELVGGAGRGDDRIDGGAGNDTVRYSSAQAACSIKLQDGSAKGVEIGSDTLSTVENVIAGQGGDYVIGSSQNNLLDGQKGNDLLFGGAGKDTLSGGEGIDSFRFQFVADTTKDLIKDLAVGEFIEVMGAAFSSITNGTGGGVGQNQVQVSTVGNMTTLHLGVDTNPGADMWIDIVGNYNSDQFRLEGEILRLSDFGNPAPQALNATLDLSQTVRHVFAAGDFRFSDADNDPLQSVTISSLPDTGTLTYSMDVDGGSRSISVDAGMNFTRSDLDQGRLVFERGGAASATTSFAFRVGDSSQLSGNTGRLQLQLTNQPSLSLSSPAAIVFTDTASDDSFAAFNGQLTGNDIDGDTLNYSLGGGTDNGTTVSRSGAYGTLVVTKNSGAYTFIPDDAAIEGRKSNASETFTLTVSDGVGSASANLSIQIIATNDMPVARDNTVVTPLNTAFGGQLMASDRDNDPLLFSKASNPAHGTVVIESNGRYVYTPVAQYAGSDSFSFKASDQGLESSATISVTVGKLVDTLPVAGNDSYALNEDITLNIAAPGILANDTLGANGGTLSAFLLANVQHGVLSLNPDGSLSYRPAVHYSGMDSFSYRIQDSDGDTANAVVTLNIAPVNDPPALDELLPDQILLAGIPFVWSVAGNFSDAEGDPLTYRATLDNGQPLPVWITLNSNSGLFSVTPASSDLGSLDIRIVASDGFASFADTLRLTVGSVGNRFNATEGSDRFLATLANDDIQGLGGVDTAVYSQPASAYQISGQALARFISGNGDGIDSLRNVERVQFADTYLAFDTEGNAGQVYRLYKAAFGRTPDLAGLGNWVKAMDEGVGLEQIATAFVGSTEFLALYGSNTSNQSFVKLLYLNALGRAPAPEEVSGWSSQLANGGTTRAGLLVSFSESTENKAAVQGRIAGGVLYATGDQLGAANQNLTLVGTTGADTRYGSVGADTLTGLAGNDTLNGGANVDTAIYSGNKASYTIIQTATGYSVSSTAEGTDMLTKIERLKFADTVLALDIDGNAGQVYRLYQAALHRTPDKGGLTGWISEADKGMTLQSIAKAFIGSAEFQTLYGANPSNDAFVTALYQNALGRAPDDGGKTHWVTQLNNGLSREMALINFSESSENQAAVVGVIQGGIELLL